MYCQYVFEGNSLAVKLPRDRIAKERMIVKEALIKNQERQTARGSSKEITVVIAVAQLRKQENNSLRSTVHCTVLCLLSDVLNTTMTAFDKHEFDRGAREISGHNQ